MKEPAHPLQSGASERVGGLIELHPPAEDARRGGWVRVGEGVGWMWMHEAFPHKPRHFRIVEDLLMEKL